jgi:hypothetical protein
MTVSRRVTLMWIAAASGAALVTAGCDEKDAAASGLWKDIALEPITAHAYGQDPSLTEPVVPWPLTLNPQQRNALHIAADLMLPADTHSPSAGTLHIDAFIDEWVSAPYPQQQKDRLLIVSGLAWLDAESKNRFAVPFAQSSDAQRRQVFDAIAFKKKIAPGYERAAQFFARLRSLMLGGFYSLPEGIADIGYMGNAPIAGPWPGPTPEALAHLNVGLVKLGLKPVNSG